MKVQQREIEQTGISSLKIGFNNVFGYYIEVRNAYKDKVPAGWIRKQTLVNAERYITEELKEYEEKILGAEEKILSLEARLFNELVLCLSEYIPPIQMNANLIGRLDCLLSFAKVAESNRYIRPDVNDSQVIDIKAGRHPVIENNCLSANLILPMMSIWTMKSSRLSLSPDRTWPVSPLCFARRL